MSQTFPHLNFLLNAISATRGRGGTCGVTDLVCFLIRVSNFDLLKRVQTIGMVLAMASVTS